VSYGVQEFGLKEQFAHSTKVELDFFMNPKNHVSVSTPIIPRFYNK